MCQNRQVEDRVTSIKFEVGKTYSATSLYGGFLTIKVVARTESTVTFVYTDDDSAQNHTQPIVVQDDYDWDTLKKRGLIESAVAWEHHGSPGYFYATEL